MAKSKKKKFDDAASEVLAEALSGAIAKKDSRKCGNPDHDHSSEQVERTIPVRPEWKEKAKKCKEAAARGHELYEELMKQRQVFETYTKSFWSTVEIDLGIYDRNMRLNTETMEIEILSKSEEDEDEED